jgi:RNA polymerase sigma factor (TIGR02999 family)
MEPDLDGLIARARDGDAKASADLAAAVYADFRRLARRFLAGERPDHTLQPTALANEVYLRLFGAPFPSIESRAEFFSAAARTIRRILIEHARARNREKRGGGRERVELGTGTGQPVADVPLDDDRLVALDAALAKLAAVDPDKARLVELRFFGGFTVAEVAQLLDSSERTIAREWRIARAFLEGEIGRL